MKPARPHSPHDPIPPAIVEQASTWLARRDRGLTAAEQDEYMQWLSGDPRHREALAQHAAALERMMQLYEWQPSHDSEPNPDLFAPVVRKRTHWAWTGGLAAAAALAFATYLGLQPAREVAPRVSESLPPSYLHVNERMALPDGSRIELKDNSVVVVQYSDTERRVKLTGGEAHFTVWKDKARPFIVEVSGVEVRAVGTAFNVRLETAAVEVLVTEGRVKVEQKQPDAQLVESPVSAGERAVVPLVAGGAALEITPVSADEIHRELGWQSPRLQFHETPLIDAVAEFNRLNRHQLVLGDPSLGALRIGGTFRPDNVEGFIRLLQTTLDLRGVPGGEDRTVIRGAN
jgi:transmembrane sensor